MNKQLLLSVFTCLTSLVFSQNQTVLKNALNAATSNSIATLTKPTHDLANMTKTLLCLDTIRYPQVKEQLLNVTPSFPTFTLWTSDAEYMSQTYLNSGGTITVSAIEFFGNNNVSGAATVEVEASVYNVDGSNNPTTLITSGTVIVTSTVADYYYVTFVTPASVTGNYAVVVRPINPSGRLDLFVNNSNTGQVQDENLSRIRSAYYPQSLGSWVSVPVLTNDLVNFPGTYDFEGLISPIISYTINTNATITTTPACLGTPITFTNTTTPTGILSSRMYNYQRFRQFFGLAVADSTYAWDFGDPSPLVWSTNSVYTYPAAGTYNSELYTLGGFWSSCTDSKITPVTINALGNSNFNYSAASYCAGTPNQTPVISQAGIFSATPAGLNFLSTTTGQINLATSAPNTYTVSYTTTGNCPTTSTQTVTIDPAANSSFSFAGNTFCSGSANQVPTVSSAGIFTSAPVGLNFVDPVTGEIDMTTSSNNTYTVTYSVPGVCASTSQQVITITGTPLGGFSYAQPSFCSNSGVQVPAFDLGASAGVFSAAPAGLTLNASGQVSTASSTAGTYVVTNTITGGGCQTVTETATVTINTAPLATLDPISSVCITDASFALSGGLPAMGNYSGLGVNNNMFSPSIAMAGIHPVTYTYVDANNCSASAIQNITVGAIPTVTMAPFGNTLCANAAAIACPVATPIGGTYSGTGVSGTTFSPSVSGVGTFQVIYTYQSTEGCVAFATQAIVVDACAAIDELNSISAMIYPNPADNELMIVIDNGSAQTFKVSMRSTDGKVVLSNSASSEYIQMKLDVSSFASGVYYVSITSDRGEMVKKVVIQ